MVTSAIPPIGSVLSYGEWISLGMITGKSRVTAYGTNPSATAPCDVWEGGGLYPFPVSASQMEVFSSSASDAASGPGARSFILSGLDSSYNTISETVAMNGTTPVQTINSYLRINSNTLASSGADRMNDGDVTIRVAGGGTVLGIARAGIGFTGMCIYSVPVGHTLFVEGIFMSVFSNTNGGPPASRPSAVFSFTKNTPAGIITTNKYNVESSNALQRFPQLGGPVNEKTDITIRVLSVNQANTILNAAIEGVLINLT